jgi:hypothetical protein
MNIEQRLESIDTSLKTLVTILQSAGAITAVAGAPEVATAAPAADTKKPRTKKTDEPAATTKADLVAGDPEGTRYWVSEETQTAYAQKPGDPDPADQSFKIESSAQYMSKKAEFAKNAQDAAAASQKPATTEPSATAQPDTASAATSGADWDTVFRAIKELSTAPTGGREAVLGVLKHFGCEGKTVPALKDLNKNAEILAHVKGLLAPAADDLGL